MKAQLFIAQESMEIRLDNGVQIPSEAKETKEEFTARVKEVLEKDLDTLELTTVDATTFKKFSVKQLQALRKTKTGLELRIIQEVLVTRGALQEHPSEGGTIFNGTQTNDDIPEEGSGKEIKPDPAVVAPEDKVETKKGKKGSKKSDEAKAGEKPAEQKKLKKQLSDEEAKTKMAEAVQNKGKKVSFLCTKTKQQENGTIKGARLDVRNNFIQYRIELDSTKEMFGKGIDSPDITFLPEVPATEEPKVETPA